MPKLSKLVQAGGELLQFAIPGGLVYQTIKTRKRHETFLDGWKHWLIESSMETLGDLNLGLNL